MPVANKISCLFALVLALPCMAPAQSSEQGTAAPWVDPALIQEARHNAGIAREGFQRCYRYLHAWLAERDTATGLIPRNLTDSRDIWNAWDAAADNFPFMALTAFLLDQGAYTAHILPMLAAEQRLTSRLDRLPDTYSFSRQGFLQPEPDLDPLIFGASEYIKDGLLPLTEYLGNTAWTTRLLGMLNDIWKYAPVETPFGNIPSRNVEVNGEMLQTLCRIYWMKGEEKYLDWAIRLGDYYLLGDQHPTRDQRELRLRDHGCEIVSGLCELYFAVAHARKDKRLAYRPAIHQMLDRILEVGLNEHGLMYDVIDPQSGAVLQPRIADNWGYNYNGFYTVYLVDGTPHYLEAARRALGNLHHYRNFDWENGSQDGYADAIEGGLNLYNRLPDPAVREWLDSEIRVMWSMQDSSHRPGTEAYRGSGIIEGWHGDGNFARTTIMYCLWKTQGTYLMPDGKDVTWGAVTQGDSLLLYMKAEKDWAGTVSFDLPRHRKFFHLPADYPRINQFPEWYTLEQDKEYVLKRGPDEREQIYSLRGNTADHHVVLAIATLLKAGEEVVWVLRPK